MQQEDEKEWFGLGAAYSEREAAMNSFVECSIAMQNFLMILLEICLILELILFLLRTPVFPLKTQ